MVNASVLLGCVGAAVMTVFADHRTTLFTETNPSVGSRQPVRPTPYRLSGSNNSRGSSGRCFRSWAYCSPSHWPFGWQLGKVEAAALRGPRRQEGAVEAEWSGRPPPPTTPTASGCRPPARWPTRSASPASTPTPSTSCARRRRPVATAAPTPGCAALGASRRCTATRATGISGPAMIWRTTTATSAVVMYRRR